MAFCANPDNLNIDPLQNDDQMQRVLDSLANNPMRGPRFVTCLHCLTVFDTSYFEYVGEYEEPEDGNVFVMSIVCPHCGGYVDVEKEAHP